MSESDGDYLRRVGREGWKPRGLVPPARAFGNIANRVDAMSAEIERLQQKIDDPSWLDFMEISDNFLAHYPPDIFTGVSGDAGPLFVVALRKAKESLQDGRESSVGRRRIQEHPKTNPDFRSKVRMAMDERSQKR